MWMNGKYYKRTKHLKRLVLGQRIWFVYVPSPLKKERQLKIGQKVSWWE